MSKAVSDDPVRNGTSRLDEMMSGVVRSTLRLISLSDCLYFIVFVIRFIVITNVGVSPWRTHSTLKAWLCCAVFYSQLVPKVTRARSVQAVVYLERHVVSFEYFVSLYNCNNRLYIIWCQLIMILVVFLAVTSSLCLVHYGGCVGVRL